MVRQIKVPTTIRDLHRRDKGYGERRWKQRRFFSGRPGNHLPAWMARAFPAHEYQNNSGRRYVGDELRTVRSGSVSHQRMQHFANDSSDAFAAVRQQP